MADGVSINKINSDIEKCKIGDQIKEPDFIQHRIKLWDKFKIEYDNFVKSQERKKINITLHDKTVLEATAWETTPFKIALSLGKEIASSTVIAKVNGVLYDLDRPFEADSTLELLDFNTKDGEYVFWHSSAHVLGEAMEQFYDGCLCYGPPVEQGFYYDIFLENRTVKPEEFKILQEMTKNIIKQKQPFERLELTKAQLLEMFDYNKFKCRIIKERINTAKTTVYRCGPLIDLCLGPHVRNTGCITTFTIVKSSSSYWEGNSEAESLQRIYGISFPSKNLMNEWNILQEEAAKRDHRKLGIQQKLFFFHEYSPGTAFFLPRGAHIYNKLVEMIRGEYWNRGYTEVISPNLFNSKLWITSGHWEKYNKDMFQLDIDKEKFGLKPMNCPGHCLMFAHQMRSYRELPLRLADFGVLHRNEDSGALSGLTRVRRFQQDDAHIFCREDQVKSEIKGCLDFLSRIYEIFGFTFKLFLSTRPENYIGEIDLWDKAEKQLSESLDEFGRQWELNPGDGAFYGPKIDILIRDALKRQHQCATIQLDFQLPIRFNLQYHGDGNVPSNESTESENRMCRPVMIHRAMLGSVERMIGVLTESFAGKWPFWLSPIQVCIIPVMPANDDYSLAVAEKLKMAHFTVEVDTDPSRTLKKKIALAETAHFNFIFVLGEKEMQNNTVNVRTRENKVIGELSIESVIKNFNKFRDNFSKDPELCFE